MEAYGQILLIAMPVFLGLVLFEKWWGWRKGKETVRQLDMISSLSSGITNTTKDVMGLSIAIITYGWLVEKVAVVHVASTFWTYLIAFIALDLAGYLTHRIDHEINFFWNSHIIHHSSEDFNLACALRQNVSIFVRVFTIFLLPAALLGVPAKVIEVVAPLHLFAQFWYHTEHIGKMGWLEKIIVTPSHHRVHHAINKEYLDKNYGQIFIVWDKWFGTFQEEMKDVKAVYGITRPVHTWNPIRINFQHLALMAKDAWRTEHFQDKFRVWFKPTGWRPADVAEKYPVFKIDDVYSFEKYETRVSGKLLFFIWIQMVLLLLFVSYLFANLATIKSPGIFVYGGFIFVYIYAFTELMDRNPYAWAWEGIKAALGIGAVLYLGDWFGSNRYFSYLHMMLIAYFLLSFLCSLYFSSREGRTRFAGVSI